VAIDVREALAAQGLDETDLATNREGRVSQTQIARQRQVRRLGGRGVWLIAGFVLVLCVGIGVFNFGRDGPGIVIFMSALGGAAAALPLGVYYGTRFADPAKVAACRVTLLENAEVGVFLPAPYRGVYAISLNHQRYSGFASTLTAAQIGKRVNAYIVPEYRIVVALEPVSLTLPGAADTPLS
jgi:hypothetical protein